MQFSVAMCTYNGGRYLGEQLESLLTQHRLPDELVVCDDGSTDCTVALLEKFAAKAPFPVRFFQNPLNLGYSRNFAQAMRICDGDLIALADQDDVWYPEKLRRLELIFNTEPNIEAVFSNGEVIDHNSRPVGRTLWQSFLFGRSDQERFRTGHAVDALLRRNVVSGMALALRRSTFDLLPDMPTSWMHDGWLATLVAIRSGLYACPERLVGYRVHQEQQVGSPPTTAGKLQLLLKLGLSAYADRVRERNLDEYQRTTVQFEDLLAFLDRMGWGDDLLRSKVRAKAKHARLGAQTLELRRMQRWQIVLPNMRSYTSFSPNGLRGIPRDLLV
jgi:glycosyltransferase involved in cell wall biosynthesis